MVKKAKKVIGINESTGEKVLFNSINEAARHIGSTFQGVQIAIMRNGIVRGWRVYDSPEVIREKIAALKKMLNFVENL